MYEFTYSAYNNVSVSYNQLGGTYTDEMNLAPPQGGYWGYGGTYYYVNKINDVLITVRAETESEAELKVKGLVVRQLYELVSIKELVVESD